MQAFPKDNLASLTWGAFFLKNLLPVTLGNIVGAPLLVGVGYWFTYLAPTKRHGRREEMKNK
jgi:formate/nitrite transporter FocA (FNT family)